ncbi:hypothetical protein L1889_03190 [Paenalcaligenes niemegkensis]|nr:hypothetical protein [Paenalcaligenes niemegkensis]MCQ9615833.1 hypothetical protein [Paenalcaligenes niemegkensis]
MFTLEQCRQILEPLRPHDVIPIVLDTQNLGRLPAWGLTFWHDAESGQKKMLFMRPSLLKQWQTRQAQQQKALTTLLQRYGLSPFRPGEQFRAPALARHLMER